MAVGRGSEPEFIFGKPQVGWMYFVYGDAKSGKTSYCLMLASHVLREGGSVVWIDCGSRLSPTRVEQVLSFNYAPPDRFYITSPPDFTSQERAVINVVSFPPKGLRLIVCDDFTYLHRLVISGNPRADLPVYKRLAFQVAILKEACLGSGLSCMLVGHVRERPEGEGREPVASRIITYWADVVLNFTKIDNKRILRIERPNQDIGEYGFVIFDGGVKALP